MAYKKDHPTSHIDPEVFEKWIASNEEIVPFMKQFDLDPDSNNDIESFKQSIRVFSSIILDAYTTDFKIAKGVVDNIKIPALKSQITHELKDGFLE
jgi:hypothetical protein